MNNTTFTSLHKPSKRIVGSGRMSEIDCTYDYLVNLFGEPTIPTDGYKTSAEWHIEVRTNDKLRGVVSIYDYKQHKNYYKDGLETHEITCWHVGGKNSWVVAELLSFVEHPHLIKYNEHHKQSQHNV